MRPEDNRLTSLKKTKSQSGSCLDEYLFIKDPGVKKEEGSKLSLEK